MLQVKLDEFTILLRLYYNVPRDLYSGVAYTSFNTIHSLSLLACTQARYCCQFYHVSGTPVTDIA